MNDILIQLFLLLAYILIGIYLKKINMFNRQSDQIFSNFILKISLPASIIISSIDQHINNKYIVILVFAIAIFLFIFLPMIGIVFKNFFNVSDIYILMFTYSNLSFIGYPVTKAAFGNLGAFYSVLFVIIFNLSIFTYGISVLTKRHQYNLKSLINPGIIAGIIALIIFVFELHMPPDSLTLQK